VTGILFEMLGVTSGERPVELNSLEGAAS